MSTPYQNQLTLSCQDASGILNAKKIFPLPPQTGSSAQYHATLRRLLSSLDLELEIVNELVTDITSVSDRWMAVRHSMSSAERAADTTAYDQFISDVPFPNILHSLKQYARSLRISRQSLADNLPDPSHTANSYIHLPKLSLPKFSGKCVDYLSFWNAFKAGIDDLPDMSDSVKFTYLKECLIGPPLNLLKPLPLTDASYQEAIQLLKDTYGTPDEISRTLFHSLRQLPTVFTHGGPDALCTQLRLFVDQFDILYLQMLEQNFDANSLSVQLELESKLPPNILEEILKAKESEPAWSTDSLRTTLKTILKRKEGVKAIKEQNKDSKLKPPQTPGHSRSGYHHPSFSDPIQNNSPHSSLTFVTTSPAKRNLKPKLPCLFCGAEQHFASYCPIYNDLSSRQNKIKQLGRCFKCLQMGHVSGNCPKPAICSKCHNPHPRPLCPSSINQFGTKPNIPKKPPSKFSSTNFSQPGPGPTPISVGPSLFPSYASTMPTPAFYPMYYPQPYDSYKMPGPSTQTPQHNAVLTMPPAPSNAHPLPIHSPVVAQRKTMSSQQTKDPVQQTNTSIVNSPNTSANRSALPVLLKCAKARIFNPNDPSLFESALILLDDASTHSYIQRNLAKILNLSLSPNNMNLGVFNNPEYKTTPSFSTTFGIQLVNGKSLIINAHTLDYLTQPTNILHFSPHLLTHGVETIDRIDRASPVVLLGADFYYELEPTPLQRLPSGYTLIHTLLGHIVAGKAFSSSKPLCHQINFCQQNDNPPIIPPADYFTLESIGVREDPSDLNNDEVHQKFLKNLKFIDNRYQISLPFKSNPETLPIPSNFGLAWGRLRSTLNFLKSKPDLLKKYNSIIDEQIKLNIIEPVKNYNFFTPPLCYLPHQPVIRQDKGKIRIVFDGSAHTAQNLSINDCLYAGPLILPNLVGILLRFRIPKYVIVSDIEKAFLQISIDPNNRDCTRFLWVKNPELPLSNNNLAIFRFTRVLFGFVCSPFLLAGTIQHHLSIHPSALTEEIKRNIYVDNIFLSADTIHEGKFKCNELIKLFSAANFNLREFTSNSQEIITFLPDTHRLPGFSHKFLGISWETDNDMLHIPICPPPNSFTHSKENILSFIASIFDPLGLISPLLLPLKIFFQSLWENKLNWNETLSPQQIANWKKLFTEWTNSTIPIPRHLTALPMDSRLYTLHCFCDASNLAMCAAVYLHISHPSITVANVHLVFSKIKVKPIKSERLTIPRMELIAALMGTRAIKFVFNEFFSVPIHSALYVWSDSSAVIGWLHSPLPIKDIFVQNRVKSIRSLPNLIVRHTPGIYNPADIGSRGLSSPATLISSNIWWNGPEWLALPEREWPPINPDIPIFHSNQYKVKASPKIFNEIATFHVATTSDITPIEPIINLTKFSRLPKVIRITAYFLRFIIYLRPNLKTILFFSEFYSPPPVFAFPNLLELRSAFLFLLRQEQTNHPPPDKYNEALGLFTDPNGIIRSKGRLGKSDLPPSTIHPTYLPPHSLLTKLIVFESHLLNSHSSPLLTLSILRKHFWIPRGRKIVEREIHLHCISCRRYTIRPFSLPPITDLPADRVTQSPPFSAVGLDYCGPIYVRLKIPHSHTKTPPTTKTWIVLWICLTTRAISLDIVEDQSGISFLLAFRRFSAKFGNPRTIYSDNAPIFTSFEVFLKTNNFIIQWKFRPPYCAWKGGHYERFNSHIKSHLRRCISRGIFPQISTFSHLQTLLFEIETAINCRPITFDSSNPMEDRPLRPIDFLRPLGFDQNWSNLLYLNEDPNDPSFTPKSDSDSLLNLWTSMSNSAKKFFDKWSRDYLLSLRERYKKIQNMNTSHFPTVGELVLVYTDSSPRSLWPIARILSVKFSEDKLPDTATIQLFPSKHVTRRSVFHLYPLECDPPNPIPSHHSLDADEQTNDQVPPYAKQSTNPPLTPPSSPHFLQLRNRKVIKS